jgi:hypothetical protein
MRAEQRAWIYSDTPVFLKPITQNHSGVWEMRIKFKLRNTGRLPAINITPIVDSPVPTFNPGDIIAEFQRANCVENKTQSSDITGDTIFPNQPVDRAITIGMWSKDITLAIDKLGHIDPWIIGCFRYRIPGDNDSHFTHFAYIVSRDAPDYSPQALLTLKNLESTFPDHLHVEPFLYKDSFGAD